MGGTFIGRKTCFRVFDAILEVGQTRTAQKIAPSHAHVRISRDLPIHLNQLILTKEDSKGVTRVGPSSTTYLKSNHSFFHRHDVDHEGTQASQQTLVLVRSFRGVVQGLCAHFLPPCSTVVFVQCLQTVFYIRWKLNIHRVSMGEWY